ncbi:MAG TPA: hypothetical protein VGE13_00150 [Candidatus Saccharimonadales bacterium]
MDGLLSKQFLDSIGVELDDQTYQELSNHYEDTLNSRIIDEITDDLDESQLQELASLRDASDQLMQTWLVANVAQLDKIVEGEVSILMGDLAEDADRL